MARYAKHTFRSGRYTNGIVRRRGMGRYIFLVILIVILVVGGVFLFKFFDSNSYDDENSFTKYAKRYFSSAQDSNSIGKAQQEIKYGKPSSVGLNYPKVKINSIDKQIKILAEREKQSFLGEHEQGSKDEKFAMLMTYDSYKGKQNIASVVLKTVVREEKTNGKLEQVSSKVSVLNFDKETGSRIHPTMVFEPGYQEKLYRYLDEYLKKNYKDKLSKNYKKYIDAKSSKFENFAFDGDKVVLYFAGNTVTDDSQIIKITISESDIKGLFRKNINSRKIDPSKPMVALTYDDGPAEGTTAKILDILEQNKAVATFFELGKNIENVSDSDKLLKRMDRMGSEIGSHSYSHPNLFTLTDEKVKEQSDLTDKAIKSRIGYVPTLYRPPYGNGNEKTTKIFNKSAILWSVDTLDWKHRNKDNVIKIIKNSGNLDGKVILMHSLYDSTAEATKEIIPWLKAQGYQLVTVSEMLSYKYNEDPKQVKFYGYNFFYPKDKSNDKTKKSN